MCGICGAISLDGRRRVHEEALRRMNEAMTHRGPNDAGLWNGGHVGLAMRRLSIIDLFRGHQPMISADGSIVVVFNGEIYNFKRLREELEDAGAEFHTTSDTEVILHGYAVWGEEALDRFNGMFAIGLFDVSRNRLLLARDRLGIKPLFYTIRDGVLTFASELDALLRSGLVGGALNLAALDAYFTFLYIPDPDSIFEGVQKLRPGEKLVVENGGVRTERFWNLEYRPDNGWTLDTAAERYRELLIDSIRLRRVSDVPLGAFLSGGVDSSSVAGVLSDMSAAPVRTFTIGFDDAHADELDYARIAAQHFGTEHTEALLHPDMVDVAAQLIRHFGEPFADSSAVPTWLVSQLARKDVVVALAGDGGDELFAGYSWLHMTRRVGQYQRIPAALRHFVDTALRLAPHSPFFEKMRRFSADAAMPLHQVFRRRETCFDAHARATLYNDALRERVAASAVDRFQEHADAAGDLSDEDRMLYQDTVMYLPGDILTKVDRMSMANSLEVRAPLLDHRMVEFAATLPFRLKYRGRTSKLVPKRAMGPLLPRELLAQRKRGFSIPIQRWFRKELRSHFQELVLGDDARCRNYLNRDTIRTLFDAHDAGKEHYGHHLWAILMFEHWLRYVESVPGVRVG